MRRINLLAGIFGCLLLFFSCTRQAQHPPLIEFYAPSVDQVLDASQALYVEVDVLDDFMVKSYRFWLETEYGWEYFSEENTVEKEHITLVYNIDLGVEISTNFSVHLEAVDNEGNRSHKKINVLIE